MLAGISCMLVGVKQASGAVIWPASISIAAIWLVEVPAAYVLSRHLGLNGVWIAYPLAISVALAAHLSNYFVVWRHRAHQKLL